MTQPPAPAPSAPVPQHHVPPDHVRIVEVGPRDGLQNDATHLTPAVRAELVTRLAASGLREIEAVSFVHPQRVPQMAGAEEVVTLARHALPATDAPALIGLVLNERGFERAVSVGLRHVRYAFPVTEGFARRNQNQTVEEALALARTLVARAREHDLQIGVVLATSFGCPFDGRVAPAHVLRVAEQVAQDAPDELVFADTIGVGNPVAVRELLRGAVRFGVPGMRLGAHFHNTRNTGYANAVAAVESGATSLDSSVGGLGGCPFAPRATGNVATEDLAYLLREMGVHTGLDLASLTQTGEWLSRQLGHALPGMLAQAGDFPA
ncbi:hydroxymethylglutaryl-CoA lyase [Deinococcus aquiradiocola]|uniref:Hydroxymethylglutaryl-CoA lyase n=1 Tax=Deinococcus aquiradiocola TaxID=393059 RepID=A0A917PJU4_9DEIO|nr:hydroxymethylglutaryl-CoA lyase [Deinococcus aquiradiocola]GGJ82118.1 hydroxymethylglutaryl-CoA lyase [Deinococcus aquiradiocola]